MDGISGVSGNLSSPQTNVSQVVSTDEVIEQESIFAKKGGNGQGDTNSSIFSQYNSEENMTSSVSTDMSATAL